MKEIEKSKFVVKNCILEYLKLNDLQNSKATVIYEVIRVIDGKILFIEDHIDRFFRSAKLSEVELKLTPQQIFEQLKQLLKANDLKIGNIKFQLQIDIQQNNQDFIAFVIPHHYPSENQYDEGVNVSVLKAVRNNPNAKIQDSSVREQADTLIKAKNLFEVVLVNESGYVTEGSRSNIFMIKEGAILTPQIEDVLPGITREYVIKVCNDLNIRPIQNKILLEELLNADALFITGTSPKVLPIKKVDNQVFDVQNKYLKAVMDGYNQVVENYLKKQNNF